MAVLGASRSGTAIVAQALAAALGVPASYRQELAADLDGIICAPDMRCTCPNLNSAAAYLDHLPHAKAIALWRHPVDFLNSRRRAFPELDFVLHCRLWTNAMTAIGILHTRHRARITVISYETLLNSRAALGRSLMSLFAQTLNFAGTFSGFLEANQPGRTALRLGRPVTALKDTGWSDAERSVFESVCGETARRMGFDSDLAGAQLPIRLDTGPYLLETGRASGGLVISPPDRRGTASALIRGDLEAGELPRLWIPALAIGGRRLFGLSLSNKAGQMIELYLEVAETLSCRLLHAQKIIVEPWAPISLEAILPAADGLIDVIITVISPPNPAAFHILLDEIVFRQLPRGTANG